MGRAKAADGSPSRKSAKAAKDPNKPKRATTAYFYFMADFREQCKKDGSVDVKKVAEVTKAASEKWKKLTAVEKKPYDDLATEDKKRYSKQMSSYVPPKGMVTGKVGKKAADPNKPKRPPSAYLLFLTDFRAQNTGKMGNKDIMKQGAEAWQAIGKAEKEKYESQASSAKGKYDQQVKNGSGKKPAAPPAKPAAKAAVSSASEDEEEMDDEEEGDDEDDDDDYNEDDD